MAAAAAEGGKGSDFYGVLGLEKECTALELRNAYKRLAMKWHPDRCLGNPKSVEEAKKKFQGIQEAYSVLSDSNKRFSYDVGVYQHDDGDENDMGDFLSEMADMMTQTKPSENGEESFEQLQELFDEMFHDVSTWPVHHPSISLHVQVRAPVPSTHLHSITTIITLAIQTQPVSDTPLNTHVMIPAARTPNSKTYASGQQVPHLTHPAT